MEGLYQLLNIITKLLFYHSVLQSNQNLVILKHIKKKGVNMKLHFVINEKKTNVMTVHLDIDLEKLRSKPNKWRDSDYFDDYNGNDSDESECPSFMKKLEMIPGIQGTSYDKYSIDIVKGEVFSWECLIVPIVALLELELDGGKDSVCSGAYTPKKQKNWLCEVLNRPESQKKSEIRIPSKEVQLASKSKKNSKTKKVS